MFGKNKKMIKELESRLLESLKANDIYLNATITIKKELDKTVAECNNLLNQAQNRMRVYEDSLAVCQTRFLKYRNFIEEVKEIFFDKEGKTKEFSKLIEKYGLEDANLPYVCH